MGLATRSWVMQRPPPAAGRLASAAGPGGGGTAATSGPVAPPGLRPGCRPASEPRRTAQPGTASRDWPLALPGNLFTGMGRMAGGPAREPEAQAWETYVTGGPGRALNRECRGRCSGSDRARDRAAADRA
jgi:hypothetical protein